MEPGKTYVTILPGHRRPVFVRKRRQTIGSGFGLTAIARVLGAPTSSSRPTQRVKEIVHSRPEPTPQLVGIAAPPIHLGLGHLRMPYATSMAGRASRAPGNPSQTELERATPQVESTTLQAAKGDSQRQETVFRHFCSSCGRYRSPGYHSRHPFRPDDIPGSSICRRCVKKYTSSEESDRGELSQRKNKVNTRRIRRFRKKWSGDSDTANTASSSKEQIRNLRRVRPISDESHPRTDSQLSSSGVVQFRGFARMDVGTTHQENHSERMINRPWDFSDRRGAGLRSSSQKFISPRISRSAQPVPRQIAHYGQDKPFRSTRVASFQYRDCVAGQKSRDDRTRDHSRNRSSLRRNSESMFLNNGLAAQTDHGYHFQHLDDTDYWQDPGRSDSRRQGLAKGLHLDDVRWRPPKSVRVVRVTRAIEEPVERLGPEALRSVGKRNLLVRDQTRLPRNTSGVPQLATGTSFEGTQRHVGRHVVEEAEDSEEYSSSGKRRRSVIRPRPEIKIC